MNNQTPTDAGTVATVEPAPLAPIAQPQKLATPINYGERGLQLTTLEDAYRFAKYAVASGLAPNFKTPEAALVAMQAGAEIGLSPMSSLQQISVINGRPTLFGDGPMALVRASGKLEGYQEEPTGNPGSDSEGFKVTVKRKGDPTPFVRMFNVADAKRAGLWGKSGPWTNYPSRMLLVRARSFALRDAFPDVLRGCAIGEEASDHATEPKNVTKSLKEELQ